jgi:Ca2+:H+ antiporter
MRRAKSKHPGLLQRTIAEEWFLGISLATTGIFVVFGERLYDELVRPLPLALIFIWLFAVVLGSALCVVRHADHVAEILGEPYGTLVLTLSVTAIEVMSISAVMLHGDNNPALVRDTMFAIAMIILGGMVGGSLLLGGWRHNEQHYNLQSANAYLGVIIPITVFALVLPNFTVTTPGPTLSFPQQLFLCVMSVGLFCAFLAIQTGRHRGYFISDGDDPAPPALPHAASSLYWHAALLLFYILPVVLLAEQPPTPSTISLRRCTRRKRSAASSSPCWWRHPKPWPPRARP